MSRRKTVDTLWMKQGTLLMGWLLLRGVALGKSDSNLDLEADPRT